MNYFISIFLTDLIRNVNSNVYKEYEWKLIILGIYIP